ncbi:putative uncharacterized protein DDB_G0282499 isoform X3 [Eurytemora carolleeae]|uniref:putative uncharacterized protein DDB_G0282499 isoform X3 n=1 Tax=Eurytemora carolleeae TaxID=1294199 RepID=UPI000C7847B8|nr:putative uncharacterized protein DDB_G0282499 isoform X3 [Eurytemora carolleeae]|eukprot:XP_023322500.1 putative uncharacterized protein DDB_G0282499 isoform X3 [Eurytemora affinis]
MQLCIVLIFLHILNQNALGFRGARKREVLDNILQDLEEIKMSLQSSEVGFNPERILEQAAQQNNLDAKKTQGETRSIKRGKFSPLPLQFSIPVDESRTKDKFDKLSRQELIYGDENLGSYISNKTDQSQKNVSNQIVQQQNTVSNQTELPRKNVMYQSGEAFNYDEHLGSYGSNNTAQQQQIGSNQTKQQWNGLMNLGELSQNRFLNQEEQSQNNVMNQNEQPRRIFSKQIKQLQSNNYSNIDEQPENNDIEKQLQNDDANKKGVNNLNHAEVFRSSGWKKNKPVLDKDSNQTELIETQGLNKTKNVEETLSNKTRMSGMLETILKKYPLKHGDERTLRKIQLNSKTEINTDNKSKISESVDGQINQQISVENQIFSESGHYFPQIIELDNHTKLDQFDKNEFSNPFYLKSEDEQNITKDTKLTSKIYNSTIYNSENGRINDQERNSETLEDDICLSTPCPETTMCVSVGRTKHICICPYGTMEDTNSTEFACVRNISLEHLNSGKLSHIGTLNGGLKVFGDSEDEDDSSDDGIEYEEYADSGLEMLEEHFEEPKHFAIHLSGLVPLNQQVESILNTPAGMDIMDMF